MWRPPVGCPEWPAAWAAVMKRYAGEWNCGRLTEHDIFRAISERTGLSLSAVVHHADACCRMIDFHAFTWQFVTERRAPQALVTVNPDLFVERVARWHQLDRHFDAIIVSCLEGTDDKHILCESALHRLGFKGDRSAALLIDNRLDLTDAWKRAGGSAYHYRGDAAFRSDASTLLE
jgi:hypothetical protein